MVTRSSFVDSEHNPVSYLAVACTIKVIGVIGPPISITGTKAYSRGRTIRKKAPVNNSTYSWHRAYVSAVLETDPARLYDCIHEALNAIEARFLSPIGITGPEYRAIEDAKRGLATLKVERIQDHSYTPILPLWRAVDRN